MSKPKPRPVTACHCGDHVFTSLNGPYLTLVSPEDRHLLEERAWQVRQYPGERRLYAIASRRGRHLRLHREILGVADPEDYVDHRNGHGLDNRRRCTLTGLEQLRPASPVTNAQNKRHRRRKASGLPKGVTRSSDSTVKPYRARIMHLGRYIHIGCFATIAEAAAAYNEKARELHGEFAVLNDLAAMQEPAYAAE